MKQKSEGFSAEQVTVLEEVHARFLYPDEQKIKNISEATSQTEREVKKWFVKRAAEQSRSLLKSKTNEWQLAEKSLRRVLRFVVNIF